MSSRSSVEIIALKEEDIVELYSTLVKRIAHHMAMRLPSYIQFDDLMQAGMIGLLEASRNFEEGHDASFETFAGIRIRGAMLDEIRKSDWSPRSIQKKAKMVADAVREIESQQGRDARAQEIADKLGIPLDEYFKMLQDTSGQKVLSLEETVVGEEVLGNTLKDKGQGVLEGLHEEDIVYALANSINGLPERERLVMALYYVEEFNLREIGSVVGLSESRICQIHNQATIRLQARMKDFLRND
ncbi:MAG: RNA polymerase sigma factor FliA [Gammaproteobacteria bacterium]|nr:RNA polymerase sigma factor FliA [Gammaproteobacteria bacterium]